MVLFSSRILLIGARRFIKRPCVLCQNKAFSVHKNVESSAEDKETHFGFETVKESEKTQKVSEVFHRVADTYDLMNDVMSAGVHRLWKDVFVERLSPPSGTRLLDVAGGTGDIAFRFVNYLKNAGHTGNVTVCDINPDMLRVGQDRARQKHYTDIDWVEGNAEELPFPDNCFTAYTIAFGLRNVTRTDLALKEAWRVLKPGGRFMCLEFSHVANEPLRWLYDRYSFQMIPAMGQVIAGDWKSYQYLVESIRKFPDQETLAGMIESAGFWSVSYENLTFGCVAIHSGFKL
ncbi:hypothetical protein GE061_010946 [Apolygus lucorum]|uniref:2-methoxy-6-polyprenyl-1,4-benzoquinol methylase, mitochondrial n=1 Tax=Apolygus lucorum TaxID=248454 RepID=A0A6A4JJW9_APOLU|nr:hypothetical protein GE061_010946 [Apolygus lucorum]